MQNKINLIDVFSNFGFARDAFNKVLNTDNSFSIKTLFGSSKSLFIASLLKNTKKRFFVVLPNDDIVDDIYDDITLLLPDYNIFKFVKDKSSLTKLKMEDDTKLAEVIDSIVKFQEADTAVGIATPEFFDFMVPKKDVISQHIYTVKQGQTLNIQEFTTQLSLNGFQREQYISKPGEYAVRGGIIDIFAPNMQQPLRIELWDDEVDTLRFFDILSQRSIQEVQEASFINSIFINSDDYVKCTIYDYISDDVVFIFDTFESFDLELPYLQRLKEYRYIKINSLENAEIVVNCQPQPKVFATVYKLAVVLQNNQNLDVNNIIAADGDIHLKRLQDLLIDIAEETENKKYDENENDNNRHNSNIIDNSLVKLDVNSLIWQNTALSSGFFIPNEKFAYFVENEIFARKRNRNVNKGKKSNIALTLKELKQLRIGEFIVHEDKGIGKFDGFQSITVNGSKQDCLRMLFVDNDILYVHLNYLHKIQKYSAVEGVVPRVNKLGSTEWLRRRSHTKKKLKDIARDLISLYAKRKMQKGFAFPPDGHWQKEFEASFIYEDTIDQQKATNDVKNDMEEPIPMDRLICGDVGFGKTEVAIRAAFKAANAGKQVAVLVPTTILAQQHYQSFIDRLGKYPINVEVISRFKKPAQIKIILEKLSKGEIDILIGTHRLLSKDVVFKDLGLLIIDEEHRFGVGAKEKLRQMKSNVDTLTLTATPIPRTLNFSLMGARDLSQIETPPRNRLPIITEVIEWDEEYLSRIIVKELKRNGQVFVVNDKISGLDKIAMDLQMLLPTIKFAIIHAQMTPKDIENIMMNFNDKNIDVLIATKIIESGIDIPNANTMIINNAQNFGLAELYQLRGRVGRSNIQAYCYLCVPNVSGLPPKSLQRLLAIQEFSDLGSGLQLALRDLEIRGSGDLLGAEQSGFISEIGFDLYQKVLAEAVTELKQEEFADIFDKKQEDKQYYHCLDNSDVAIETNQDAFFPENYVEDDTARFKYYKALFEVENNDQLKDIIAELEDKYGKMPEQAKELIFVVKLRIAVLGTGIAKIIVKENELVVELPTETDKEFYEQIFPIMLDYLQINNNIRITQKSSRIYIYYKTGNRLKMLEFLWNIKKTIEASVE